MARAVYARVRAIVDPCGRVLIHELEQLTPGEEHASHDEWKQRGCLADWHRKPWCREYVVELTLPVPELTEPVAKVLTLDKEE